MDDNKKMRSSFKNNASANYGNIRARQSQRDRLESDTDLFIKQGGKIEVLPSFQCSKPKAKFDGGQSLVAF